MKINDRSTGLEESVRLTRKIVNADQTVEEAADVVVKEHFLDVFVNERLVAKLVCTPSHLVELVLGRLVTEGIILGAEDVESIYICEKGHTAKVFLKEEAVWHADVVQEPTCCTGNQVFLQKTGAGDLKPLPEGNGQEKYPSKWIFALADIFAEDSKIHRKTKGTHSCYLGVKGQCVFSGEDIGRHNAMDKCIGYMLLKQIDPSDGILFTTGRVPTDMVKKAVAAGVPVLVSKAVPTDAAVEMAAQYNLTLVCKAWPDRYEIYHEGK